MEVVGFDLELIWCCGLSLVAGGTHVLEVCFCDCEENWESWGKKGKKKQVERREKLIIF